MQNYALALMNNPSESLTYKLRNTRLDAEILSYGDEELPRTLVTKAVRRYQRNQTRVRAAMIRQTNGTRYFSQARQDAHIRGEIPMRDEILD